MSVFGRSNLALLENAMDYLLGSELPLCRCQPFISSFDISQTVAPKPINFTIFQKTQLDLSVAIKYFAQTAVVFFFALISTIYEKWAIFDILMTIYLGGNMINR